MKECSGNEVGLPNISGDENQECAVAELCLDYCELLRRIIDIETGEAKNPKWRWDRTPFPVTRSLEDGQKFEDSAPFQNMASDNSTPHKSDRLELQASSEQGFIMCMWLLQSFQSRQKRTKQTIIEQWLKRPATVEKDPRRSPLSDRFRRHYRITVRCPAPPPPLPSHVPFNLNEAMNFNTAGELVRPSAHKPDLLWTPSQTPADLRSF